ncbi:acyl-CoA dehydrogenase/oxidase C-terminal [Rhexocercosporidium sp. MPI-PUGE-AT-0058]|nr:acyl-CoA dehydrogenase/oxidase C-terminal [Rhexocercosporidium sp. MPI-PUGE-AT-0058]
MSDFTSLLKPAQPLGPDTLAKERQNSPISEDALARHLFSAVGFLRRQQKILKALENKKLFSKDMQQNLSRPDRFKLGLARAKQLRRMQVELSWSQDDLRMAEYLVDEMSPFALHMLISEAYWMPKIESFEIIGAYAQTELGHGSNVKGIELEARYDTKTKEFVLHSPTLTSSKWWNGTLGRTASHAIVIAQLLLPDSFSAPSGFKNYGPHAFVVQVRDMKIHQPLPVAVGDINAKYGYTTMDNAYCLFDNFRIPHSAFLCRYSKVDDKTGAYTKPHNLAVLYGSLTQVRASIVMHARLVLARAVTIAVRYLSICRQFRDRDGSGTGDEMAVLDYPTVQIRVLPLLATTYALHYSGRAMAELYSSTRKGIVGGDFSKLADLHSTSSGLKSLCTTLATDGIETCRRALGGQGFGGGSGLILLNNDYLSKPTVEGDNWMITQQTAAHLIKKVQNAATSRLAEPTDNTDANIKAFLTRKESGQLGTFNVLGNDQAIVDAFKQRAAHLSVAAYEARNLQKRHWNSLLIQLHKLSNAHSQLILIPSSARTLLRDLFRLFALYTMDCEGREFSSSKAVSSEQLDKIPSRIEELMLKIRVDAVKLVDAWMIPDFLLDSALGRYDGKVCEDLFNRAHRLNPLNKITFNPYYWDEEIVMGSQDGGEILAKL